MSSPSNNAAYASRAIQPVIRRFPASQDLLEDTNLPFSLVVTPLGTDSRGDLSRHTYSLSTIPKCLSCGAPHASPDTHFKPKGSRISSVDTFLLCYLCGKLSSTSIEQQQEKRASLEGDLIDTASTASPLASRRTSSSPLHVDTKSGLPTTFELPLRLRPPSASTQSANRSSSADNYSSNVRMNLRKPIYSVPAIACPPIWFLLLDGSNTNPRYWHTAGQVLQDTMKDMPPHVHVSILISSASATQGGSQDGNESASAYRLGIYQLASPMPYVRHYSDDTPQAELCAAILSSLVDGSCHMHVQAACRSLMDYSDNAGSASGDTGMALAWTTELLLETLQSYAQPAGQRGRGHHQSSGDDQGPTPSPLPYAGGKLTCLLSNPPADIFQEDRGRRNSVPAGAPTERVGFGGFGGRTTSVPGQRFQKVIKGKTDAPLSGGLFSRKKQASSSDDSGEQSLPNELTPEALQESYHPIPDVAVYFDELGRQCAQASIGVDLLCLCDSGFTNHARSRRGMMYSDDHLPSVPDMALPLYGSLSHKSGAPGPLLFDMNVEDSMILFRRELQARTPWQPDRVFGAELRLRLSPGYAADDSAVERDQNEEGPQLAPLYADGGLLGPGCAVDESTHLWRMGVCDPHTSFTIDLAIQNRAVRTSLMVDNFGEIALKPVVQTCFAYTTIIFDEATEEYMTVRQMKIHSRPVPLAQDTESVYSSLDPEALAVVLFHKLALASFQDGLKETAVIAEDWLQSTLISVYQSAERYAEKQSEHEQSLVGENGQDTNFFAAERLLDRGGELDSVDVLLAQGHDRLRPIALLTYLLMQCDAFRPHATISTDLRYAALSQLVSMTPTNLTRCIAPRLQLWSSAQDEKEPILEIIDLRSQALQQCMDEYSNDNDLILFLDAPHQIAVIDGQYFGKESDDEESILPLVLGNALKTAITEAAHSYRTQPLLLQELNCHASKRSLIHALVSDVLMEDTPSDAGHNNFSEWSADIAECVQE